LAVLAFLVVAYQVACLAFLVAASLVIQASFLAVAYQVACLAFLVIACPYPAFQVVTYQAATYQAFPAATYQVASSCLVVPSSAVVGLDLLDTSLSLN
jgi:hypothetical protein|tara:strand:+ start:610 stop:903 length:294 start_codon:yes stop_codon:yes gene_type:complete